MGDWNTLHECLGNHVNQLELPWLDHQKDVPRFPPVHPSLLGFRLLNSVDDNLAASNLCGCVVQV